jgi:protein-tyrosine phosphatase
LIDLHNHLIPGVDDGAADAGEARSALAEMVRQGVGRLVCTPHVRGGLTASPAALGSALAEVDRGWDVLAAVAADFPGLVVERGAEVMLDTPSPDLSDPRLRLAGTRFVLVEFPFMSVPPNDTRPLFELKVRGWTPVLAHPERYGGARPDLADAAEWRRVGAVIQVNAGSLLGRYGAAAEAIAWGLMERGWVDCLASDHHARGRLALADCRAELTRRGGGEQARLLMEDNPARLLAGEDPLPVPPLQQRPAWRRLLGLR